MQCKASMRNPRGTLLLVFAAFLAGCSSTTSPLPLTDTPPPASSSSSVFAGHARAFRFVQGPDLILCDVNMEKVDAGYFLLGKLREDSATAAIPFIFITGKHDAAGMRHGMDLGAVDYLPKPFKVDELYATVNARLRKAQTVREEAEKKLSLLRSQISLMLPHEMRTPLNGIISNSELLAESADSLDPKTIAEMSQEICQSGQRLERLIENFLIYAQLEIVASDPQSIGNLRAAKTSQPAQLVRAAAMAQAEKAGRVNDLVLDLHDTALPMAEDYFKKIAAELVQNALRF